MEATNKLIILQGLPASGKSTWTRELVESNPEEYVQVELDILRQERGLSGKDTPKDMLKERDELVLKTLRAGKTVIISDTNLSSKALRRLFSLANQSKVSYEINNSFLSVPVEVCIERDAQREESKRVGKEVILSMYSRYRDDLPVVQEQVIVIGDVHGEYQLLLQALKQVGIEKVNGEWINPNDYKAISLGDLNDPRLSDPEENNKLSSWQCLRIAKELSDLGWMQVIQSNHQLNLVNWFFGRRKKLTHGLDVTVNELKNLGSEYDDEIYTMIKWLEGLPFYYQFKDNKGRLYTCAHAAYTPGMSQFHPSGAERADVIYGTKTKDDERLHWWLDPESLDKQDSILVSGHYHEAGFFHDSDNELKAILLDGGAGFDNGILYTLKVSKDKDPYVLNINSDWKISIFPSAII